MDKYTENLRCRQLFQEMTIRSITFITIIQISLWIFIEYFSELIFNFCEVFLLNNINADFKYILEGKKHIHFIGIGGSGMYPLAQILHSKGFYLTGSDNNETDTLAAVRKMGIPVYMGQRAENIEGADLIVHTAAIMEDNPELIAARNSGVPVIERSILLGLVTSWYDNAVCVCGTHGKTTVSSLLTQIFMEAGRDISAVIGGKLPLIGGSGRCGSSDIMVCEACEFMDHFLMLSPDTTVVLNVDADHLEYFKNIENIIKSFHKFCEMTTKNIIVNGDDVNSMKAVEGITGKNIVTFGISDKNDYYPSNLVTVNPMKREFDLMHKGERLVRLTVNIPGEHNILNAVAAAAAAIANGLSPEEIVKGMASFHGAKRRFEKLAEVKGVTVCDDYGHHPAELTVTLNAAMEMGFKRVWAVFQPFTFSRTAMLLDDFAKALSIADRVVLTSIMGSREKNTYNIYTKDLAAKIDGAVWFEEEEHDANMKLVAEYLAKNVSEGDLVLTMGCGDCCKAANMLIDMLRK